MKLVLQKAKKGITKGKKKRNEISILLSLDKLENFKGERLNSTRLEIVHEYLPDQIVFQF